MTIVVFLVMLLVMLVCMAVGGVLMVRPARGLYRTTRSAERGMTPLLSGLGERADVAGRRADVLVDKLDAFSVALNDLVTSAERLAVLFQAFQEGRGRWHKLTGILRQ
jgi:hypothetical protein